MRNSVTSASDQSTMSQSPSLLQPQRPQRSYMPPPTPDHRNVNNGTYIADHRNVNNGTHIANNNANRDASNPGSMDQNTPRANDSTNSDERNPRQSNPRDLPSGMNRGNVP